jgi:hypothetical protein
MVCEYLDTCPFMENINRTDPHSANSVRTTYCALDKYGCARYGLLQVLTTDDVPDFLWPNDEEEALEVIKLKLRSKDKGLMGKVW